MTVRMCGHAVVISVCGMRHEAGSQAWLPDWPDVHTQQGASKCHPMQLVCLFTTWL